MKKMNSQCKQCSKTFRIEPRDFEFYKKIDVPSPTLCPNCRQQRRMVWRNEMILHERPCDLCKKNMITPYALDAPYVVYCAECWLSDDWNVYKYGQEIDFSRPLFVQIDELLHKVPHLGVYAIGCENSAYNQSVTYLKNCYMLSSSNRNEDCYYGNYVNDCKNCVDNLMISKSELCYECVECEGCYGCSYAKNAYNCTDCSFIQNCTGCTDCFGCINLVRKQYCWFNEQLTQTEYFNRLQQVDLNSPASIQKYQQKFFDFTLLHPNKYIIGTDNESVTGNSIFHSKDIEHCFDVSHLEKSKYCYWLHNAKDCMDIFSWGFPAELCYECMSTGDHAYDNQFCVITIGSKHLRYSVMCKSSQDLFGCVSVKNGKYCILNKQYSASDYHLLVKKIIAHGKKTGEWGQFFPNTMAPFPYNETAAYFDFPLNQEVALQQGLKWNDTTTAKSDDKTILVCERCQHNYKITQPEENFYLQNKIPRPQLCYLCRHKRRLTRRNPRQLWHRQCMCTQPDHVHGTKQCPITFDTSYAPERKEIVYCEECYRKEIY